MNETENTTSIDMGATKAVERELRETVALLQQKAKEFGDWRSADAMTKEAFTKMNARIDELQDTLKDVTKRAMRTGNGGDTITDKANDVARAALVKYLRRGEQRLTSDEREALEGMQKALSVDSDPDGGFVVTPAMSARISSIIYETSPVRQIATVETISTDALEGLFDGDEVSASWVTETGTRAETDTPELGMWRIPTHELYAKPKATQKLLDDASVDIEAWLQRKVADKMARTENAAFVSGTGVGQPRGFTTYADGSTRGTITRLPSLAAATIAPEAIINMVYHIKPAYRAGAVWAMNRATVGVIRTLRDDSGGAGTGQFFWQPGFGTQPASLAGYPITELEDMDDVSAGNIVAAFGNFRAAYTIVDRQGTRVLRDPYSAKPYVEFYTTRRVGGDVINFEAIVLMDIAAS
jgi:HK97 family phage major capsid protein